MNNYFLLSATQVLILLATSSLLAQTRPTTSASKKYEGKLEIQFDKTTEAFQTAAKAFVRINDDTQCTLNAYELRPVSNRNRKTTWVRLSPIHASLSQIKNLNFRYFVQDINDVYGTAKSLAVQTTYYFETTVNTKPTRVEMVCLQDKLFTDDATCSQPETIIEKDSELVARLASKMPNLSQEIHDLRAVYDRYEIYSTHRICIAMHLGKIDNVDMMDQLKIIGGKFFQTPSFIQKTNETLTTPARKNPGLG